MTHQRWQALIAVGGLLLVGVLLVGRVSQLPVGQQPAPGGSYREAVVGRPARLNPLFDHLNSVDRDIDRLIFGALVSFDYAGLPMPDLAEGWTISPDGIIYTFALRPGLRWQDGAPLTADDVVFTFGLLQQPDFPGRPDLVELWRQVQITKIDRWKVSFKLPEPFAPFLDYVGVGLLPVHALGDVVPTDLDQADFNLHPLASGPFQLESLDVRDGQIVGAILQPNPNYHGQRPFLNRLEFVFVDSPQQALEAYQRDEVDGVSRVTTEQLESAMALPAMQVYSGRLPEFTLIYLNLKASDVEFFQDKKVRQALLLGLNRQWMIDHLLHGQAFLATGPILPGSWAYHPNLQPLPFDPQRAADMLDELGWTLPENVEPGSPDYIRRKGDQLMTFTLVTTDDAAHIQLAEAVQADWARLGVQTGVKAVPAAELLQDYLEPRAFQAALVDINLSRYPDPDPYPFWHETQKETGQNYGQFGDRNVSELLERARQTPDLQDRAKLYRTFQSRFADQVPALLLFYPVYSYGVDAKVQSVSLGPLFDTSDRFANVVEWYVLTRRAIEEGK